MRHQIEDAAPPSQSDASNSQEFFLTRRSNNSPNTITTTTMTATTSSPVHEDHQVSPSRCLLASSAAATVTRLEKVPEEEKNTFLHDNDEFNLEKIAAGKKRKSVTEAARKRPTKRNRTTTTTTHMTQQSNTTDSSNIDGSNTDQRSSELDNRLSTSEERLLESLIDTPEPNDLIEEEEMTTTTAIKLTKIQPNDNNVFVDVGEPECDENHLQNEVITTQEEEEEEEEDGDQSIEAHHHHHHYHHHESRIDRIDTRLTETQLEALSSLFMIIKEGDYKEFLELLERKGSRNMLNVFVDGQTALHYSLIYGRSLAWCKQLISNGANPNLTNRAGWHPIHLAAFNGSRETMRYLIDCIAN